MITIQRCGLALAMLLLAACKMTETAESQPDVPDTSVTDPGTPPDDSMSDLATAPDTPQTGPVEIEIQFFVLLHTGEGKTPVCIDQTIAIKDCYAAQPPAADWGAMLAFGRKYMLLASWTVLFPGIALFVSVMGFNLIGDSLRDALDPRLRRLKAFKKIRFFHFTPRARREKTPNV